MTVAEPHKFLLVSLPRCGSTSLMHSLNCHPDISCLHEPFSPSRFCGQYGRQATDPASLRLTMAEIWRAHNGIKHVWDPSGWPFARHSTLNQCLLLEAEARVIFLRRSNVLRRLVSNHMSMQTQIWDAENEETKNRARTFHYEPLDIPWIRVQLEEETIAIAQHKQLMLAQKIPFLELCYEDLYASTLSLSEKLTRLNAIFAFLGAQVVEERNFIASVSTFLDPDKRQLNSPETYHLIPGIEKVEEQFGSDDTGWLFK